MTEQKLRCGSTGQRFTARSPIAADTSRSRRAGAVRRAAAARIGRRPFRRDAARAAQANVTAFTQPRPDRATVHMTCSHLTVRGAMRRREFLAWLGGAALASPLAARAQQGSPPVIGYLSAKGETAELGIVAAIRQGLRERGFVEGKTVILTYRWSDGDYSRLPRFAAELVASKVNVIAASGLPAALAAQAATPTTPIVFRLAVDPVA